MNLNEYIDKASDETIVTAGLSYGYNIKNTSISDIRSFLKKLFSNPDEISNKYKELTNEQKDVLDLIISHKNIIQEFSILDEIKNRTSLRNILLKLTNTLFIIPFCFDDKRDIYYTVPDEIESILIKKYLKQYCIKNIKCNNQNNLGCIGFIQDIFTFVLFIKKNSPKLTAQKKLFKKSSEQLKSILFTDRFEIIEYCSRLFDLVRYTDHGIILNNAMIDKWLETDYQTKLKVIFQASRTAAIGLYNFSISLNSVKLIEQYFLDTYPDWLTLPENFKSTNLLYHDEPDNTQNILNFYIKTGLIESAVYNEKTYYRYTDEGAFCAGLKKLNGNYKPEQNFYIQPNFDVLFPFNLDFKIRWKLSLFADLQKADNLMTAKLSQNSITNGIASGLTYEEILDFIKKYAKESISQNVEFNIKSWSEKYGQVFLIDAVLLDIKNKDIIDELKNNNKINDNIVCEISDGIFAIKRNGINDILKILNKKGYTQPKDIKYLSEEYNVKHDSEQYNNYSVDKLYDNFINWNSKYHYNFLDRAQILSPQIFSYENVSNNKYKMNLNYSRQEIFNILDNAVKIQRPIEILYASKQGGKTIQLMVQPLSMNYSKDNGWSIICKDMKDRKFISVLLNNVIGIEEL